jgi:ADP-ribose pyrophosphatase YjhB (NUDIX family)
MADGELGRLHRWALSGYRRLPRALRVTAVRLLAPSHTVGAVCLIEHGGRLLVLRQHHRDGWTLPGGLINRGEDAQAAVRREVREETGLDVEVGLPIGVVVEPRSRRVDIVFHAPADRAPQVRPRGEALVAQWLSPADLGPVDDPTAAALDVLERSRAADAHRGRLLAP